MPSVIVRMVETFVAVVVTLTTATNAEAQYFGRNKVWAFSLTPGF